MENEKQPQNNYQQKPLEKRMSVGVALILGISGIIITAIIAGTIIFTSGAKMLNSLDVQDLDGLQVQINEQGNETFVSVDMNKSTEMYTNSELGFSFYQNKELGNFVFKKGAGTTGKNFFGTQGCEAGDNFCMFVGGVTTDYTFPGELNANEVSEYPSDTRLQSLSANGYMYEKRVNTNGAEYVLIHGKKETDMPYIGEGQAVAIFKLTSSSDFKAMGFQLVSGDMNSFMQVIESVKVF
jgi:hypothetical protein